MGRMLRAVATQVFATVNELLLALGPAVLAQPEGGWVSV
jgi:hypothetical protein